MSQAGLSPAASGGAMRIALDAAGSDGAPAVEVEGALAALSTLRASVEVLLVGDRDLIEPELSRYGGPVERLRIVHAPDRIDLAESPAQAIRRKPESSIVVGLGLLRRGEADAFISAGSTGAVLAGSLFLLRPLPGVDRPAVGAVLPTLTGHCLLLDAGANVDTRPAHLLQFAQLGAIYAQDLLAVERPRVGLLNIGEEPGKGDERTVEAHRLLSDAAHLNFVGNVEGRDVLRDRCDVLVTDGFAGNVLLKFYESVARFIGEVLQRGPDGADAGPHAEWVHRSLDYTDYGGAPLLGVNGISIICHGGSPPRAIANAIRVAARSVERGLVEHLRTQLAQPVTA